MADLEVSTRPEGGDGRYTAVLDPDWEIWGPNGGYVAAVLLRAAGAEAGLPRPASLHVQFLAVASFAEVTLTVTELRRTRRAACLRVAMDQDGTPIAEATAWFVAEGLGGLDHTHLVAPPPVPGPEVLDDWATLVERHGAPRPPFPFWDNIQHWPLDWRPDWPPPGPLEPVTEMWARFRPTPTFADPVVDACRSVVLLDTMGWPAAYRQHAWKEGEGLMGWIAPSLDLYVAFHGAAPTCEHLLLRAESPVGADGLLSATGRLWAEDGTFLASSSTQLLCRPVRPPA